VEPTLDDISRLIKFSLKKNRAKEAFHQFPMFSRAQIMQLYMQPIHVRYQLLFAVRVRAISAHSGVAPEEYRNPEQRTKMAEIATDPSNR